MQNNFVSHFDRPWLRYTTGTEEGSSGSPVFNEEFEVVAIHHGAREFEDLTTRKSYVRNEGASMAAVLDDLQSTAPEIYERIVKH
jgi:V8-like Glu-specific endopeptidase